MTQAQEQLDASVIFLKPSGFSDNWTKTGLWRAAVAIPGVSAMIDDGREARLFGAATSGQTMVYGPKAACCSAAASRRRAAISA